MPLIYASHSQLASASVSFPARPAASHSVRTMNAKTSSAGEEEASGMSNEALGEAKRQQVIRVAYVIAALDLTFLFMQMGLVPVSMGSLPPQHISFNAGLQQSQKMVFSRKEERYP